MPGNSILDTAFAEVGNLLKDALVDLYFGANSLVVIVLLFAVLLMARAGVSYRQWFQRLAWLMVGAVIAMLGLFEKVPLDIAAVIMSLCVFLSNVRVDITMTRSRSVKARFVTSFKPIRGANK